MMAALLSERALVILLLLTIVACTDAYQTAPKPILNRREWLSLGTGLATAAAAQAIVSPAQASQYCASGVGDGCDSLSEGNALIKSLQEKSAANKDKYAKVRV